MASRTVTPSSALSVAWEPFPDIDLRQLLRLTDDTGMFQHAHHLLPDPNHGYCIDDNARALIAALLHAQLRGYDEQAVPLQRYLGFVVYAFNPDNGRFRNFMSYDRRWLEDAGSEDSHGRAIWALGTTVRLGPDEGVRTLAEQLFRNALPACREQLHHLRPWAFVLLGLDEFLKARPDDTEVREFRDSLAQQFFDAYQQHATDDWPWWEDTLTWGNARLPHALLVCGQAMGRPGMVDAALRALAWCLAVQTAPQGHLSIVGNAGWFPRGGPSARFDQQPIEAYALVEACLAAAEASADPVWADRAWQCFEWFRGQNDLGIPLYQEQTGGCQDGLSADGPNVNQGAESSLAYLLSVLRLHQYRAARTGRIRVQAPRTLGYAVIGASGFARFCLEQYEPIADLKPVAVWNRTAEKAHGFADRFGLRAYDELEAMLRDPDVHLVHVATTPALHAEHALAALQHGKHVLCEKPLATSLADAQRMIQAAAERDLSLNVNFMMRFGPLAEPVGQLIASGLLGAPLRGSLTNRAGDAGLPPGHWFWDPAQSGGIFVEHGVHFFDLFRAWLGGGEVLNALRLRRPQTDLIDQAACEVRYGPQTTVAYYHGFHQPTALDGQDFRLIFERGQLVLTGWIADRLNLEAVLDEAAIEQLQALFPQGELQTLQRFEGDARTIQHRGHKQAADRVVRLHIEPDQPDGQRAYGEALRALMADTIAAIQDRQHRPRVTAEDGRAALELALHADALAKGITP